ncbi:MAG: hypothetical protein WCI36_02440 [bacterium]
MNQKPLLIIAGILMLILSTGVGFVIGNKTSKNGNVAGGENTYQAGWDGAMKTLKDSGSVPTMPEGIEIKNINGTIESINGNEIKIKVSTPGLINTPALTIRAVTIDGNTKIVQLAQRDQAQIQKEMEAFNEKMKNKQADAAIDPRDFPTPPQMQEEKPATIADLKVGQMIMITTGEDIKTKQAFVALEIKFQQLNLNNDPAGVPVGSVPNPNSPIENGGNMAPPVNAPQMPSAPPVGAGSATKNQTASVPLPPMPAGAGQNVAAPIPPMPVTPVK